LRSDKLRETYRMLHDIGVMKSKRMKQPEHVARMGEEIKEYITLSGILVEWRPPWKY
jgi:hypothetical protein